MSYTPKNWTKNTYTNGTWFDLVAEKSIVNTVIFCNKALSNRGVSIRIFDGTNEVATLLKDFALGSNESFTLDLKSLPITAGQSLQCKVDADDVDFLAGGVTY